MMGWCIKVAILLSLRVLSLATGVSHSEHPPADLIDDNSVSDNSEDYENIPGLLEDAKFDYLTRILANILIHPWPKGVSPLIYVENNPVEYDNEDMNFESENELSPMPFKRSKYYRKYPWKRQNSRYDAENRYLCQPSKDDVYRLLVALHEARQGNRGSTINFCNRKRPASAIFTNIRFLGK